MIFKLVFKPFLKHIIHLTVIKSTQDSKIMILGTSVLAIAYFTLPTNYFLFGVAYIYLT